MRRKSLVSILLFIVVFSALLCGCNKRTEVPDIMDKDEKIAVKLVEEAGLVPIVEYEYREHDEKDKVFMTRPRITTSAKLNSEVVIYISKGPETIMAKDSYCKWSSMGGKSKDQWKFTLPYINKGILYIDCDSVIINDAIKWVESNDEGICVVETSLTEDFEESFQAKVKIEKTSTEAGEAQHIVMAVDMEELKDEKPDNLSFRIPWEKNGVFEEFIITFNITW